MAPLALQIDAVAKTFPSIGDAPAKSVIEALTLKLAPKERVALIGPSGCGKSTLLNMAVGLEAIDQGQIHRPPGQRVSFVFQEPRLLSWRSVADNLRLVLPKSEVDESEVSRWLDAVGLTQARDVFASRLSLGMARRAAIARAFIVKPHLLLMDEPFVSLDAAASLRLQSLLLELLDAEKTSLLFVTHDLREAIRICDRLLFLSPAPSRCLFECPIGLSQAERQNERTVETFRERMIEDYGIDAGHLAIKAGPPHD